MKNAFNVTIDTPCAAHFDSFTPTAQGGFCGACQKEVIDFTKMNAQEIAHYFQNRATQNTCGRFTSQQLTTYTYPPKKRNRLRFLSSIGIAMMALFSFGKIQGQELKKTTSALDTDTTKIQDSTHQKNIVVKGTVTENGMPLPGANIILEGTATGVSSDFDGYFEFPEKLKKGDVLVVSFIGYTSKKIVIQNENSANNIALKVNLEEDSCVLLGAVSVNQIYSSKKD